MSIKPPFLFRAASKQSRGINTSSVVDPLAGYESEYHADISSIPFPELRQMVHDHIKFIYKSPSEFSSRSVSLLYVLVHAIRKTYAEDEDEVLIYVMDTRKLPTARIRRATEMIKECDVKWAGNLVEYAQGEYLVHGKLEHTPGLWQAVEFKDLVTAGVKKAFPALQERQHLLFQRVLELRIPYFRRVWEVNPGILDMQKRLAECFGDEWQGVVMVALVAIRNRDKSEDGIAVIEASLGSMQLPTLPWSTSQCLRGFQTTLRTVPEAQQFMQILRLLHGRQQEREREKETMVTTVEVQEVEENAVIEQ